MKNKVLSSQLFFVSFLNIGEVKNFTINRYFFSKLYKERYILTIKRVLFSLAFIVNFYILNSQCSCASSLTQSIVANFTPSTTGSWQSVSGNFYPGYYLKIKVCPGSTYEFTNCNSVTGGALSNLGQFGSGYDAKFVLYDENWTQVACNSQSGNSNCPNACHVNFTVPSSASYQYLYLAVFNESAVACGNTYSSTKYSVLGYKVTGSVTCCTNWSTSGDEYVDYLGDNGFVTIYASGTCSYTISNTNTCPSNFSLTAVSGGVNWSIAKSCTSPSKSCTINVQSNGVTKTTFSLNQSGYTDQTTVPSISCNPTPMCNGQNATLSIDNYDSDFNYGWSTGGSGVQSTITTPSTYSVTCSDNCGSQKTGSITVQQATNPPAPTLYIIQAPCSNGTGILQVLNSNSDYAYEWDYTGTPRIGEDTVHIQNLTSSKTVKCRALNSCGLFSNYSSISISPFTSNYTVKINRLDSNKTLCASSSTTVIDTLFGVTTPPCGSCSYVWLLGTDTVGRNANLPIDKAGTYYFEAKSTCAGNKSAYRSVSTPEIYVPVVKSTPDTILCINSSSILSISNLSDYENIYTCLWNNNSTNSTNNVAGSGPFFVTVKNKCGSDKTSQTRYIPVRPSNIKTPVFNLAQLSVCTPSTDTLFVSSTSQCEGCIYQWYCSGNCNNGPGTSKIISNSGQVKVKATNQCGDTAITTLIVGSTPIANITASDSNLCKGGSVVLTATLGSSYAWNNGKSTRQITVDTVGIYTVTVTNPLSCIGSPNASKTIVWKNQINANAGRDTSVNIGSSLVLGGSPTASNGTGAYSYQWNGNASSQNTPNPTVVINSSFKYYVTVQDGVNCSSITSINVVAINGCESLVLNKDSIEINRDSRFDTIKVTAPNNCQWTASNNNSSMMFIQSGNTGAGSEPLVQIFVNACTNNADREGVISIEGKKYKIKQKCSCAVSGTIEATKSNCTISAQEYASPYKYYWYLNDKLIDSTKTTRIYEARRNGIYNVKICKDGCCSNKSKDIAIEGCESSNSSIQMLSENSKFSIYPNPANFSITIKADKLSNKDFELRVINSLGQEMISRTVKNSKNSYEYSLDVSQLPVGIYQLQIKNNSQSHIQSFEVNR